MEKQYPNQRYELFTSGRSEKNKELYQKLGYKIFDEQQVTEELGFVYGESIKLWKKERLSMWNAEIYNRYGKERIQPSIDLVARIKDMKFKRIVDVGCGTGMSTAPLVSTWENAEIIGVDLSKEMLEKAREILPIVTFIQRDCSKPLFDMGAFDLIFCNAFVHRIL